MGAEAARLHRHTVALATTLALRLRLTPSGKIDKTSRRTAIFRSFE